MLHYTEHYMSQTEAQLTNDTLLQGNSTKKSNPPTPRLPITTTPSSKPIKPEPPAFAALNCGTLSTLHSSRAAAAGRCTKPGLNAVC